MTDHAFWITSRAAGVCALALASLSVGLGLAMAMRLGGGRLADRRVVHEALSLGAMAAIVVHAGALLGDGYLRPGLADIAIPFASSFQTGWMALGIVSGWGTIAFGVTYYARRHIGRERWKVVHRLTALTWLGAVAHGLGMGSDAAAPWFVAVLAATALPALVLLLARVAGEAPAPVVPEGAAR